MTFGNKIGRTIKVDKNTMQYERGKYVRLSVVNLSKPLLAMFNIKGRKYKIEYKNIHLLCLSCGRYGHYKEDCPTIIRGKGVLGMEEQTKYRATGIGSSMTKEKNTEVEEGKSPWKMVHKQRRGKKVVDDRKNIMPTKVNDEHRWGEVSIYCHKC